MTIIILLIFVDEFLSKLEIFNKKEKDDNNFQILKYIKLFPILLIEWNVGRKMDFMFVSLYALITTGMYSCIIDISVW